MSRCTSPMQQDVLLSGVSPAATSPYTVNKDSKKGPAWSNSLFEDNAEHGLGMYVGQKYLRDQAIENVKACAASDKAPAEVESCSRCSSWRRKMIQRLTSAATDALIAELEKAAAARMR